MHQVKRFPAKQESSTPEDTGSAGADCKQGTGLAAGRALNLSAVQRCNLLILGSVTSLRFEVVNVNGKDLTLNL